MRRVAVLCEGPTEETFTDRVLAPTLVPQGVYLYPRLFGRIGGDVRWPRIRRDILASLKSDRTAVCTTLIDFYGRGPGFPGEEATRRAGSTAARKQALEEAMFADIAGEIGEHDARERFLPYVQMHEFEGLLFAGTDVLARVLEVNNDSADSRIEEELRAVRAGFPTPEDINDGPSTAPSKRILRICPSYQKIADGTLVAAGLKIGAIRAECPLFDAWVGRLERWRGVEGAG